MLPVDAEIIPNKRGTAPAMYFEKDGRHAFCLPGVPHEMKNMVSGDILPRLRQLETRKVHTRIIRTVGVPESTLYNMVKHHIEDLPENVTAFLPHGYGVDIRLLADETDMSESRMNQLARNIKATVGQPVYAEEDVPLSAVIGEMLRDRELTLATAESCTGGMLADEVTNISGSSNYFLAGYITYSNEAKMRELSVPEDLLIQHGAVSEEVAASMATGALKASGAGTALSTTGIAGPTGGTKEKPVGLVYIGCAIGEDVIVRKHEFSDDRRLNKMRSVYAALNLLRTQLFNR
jgi:nicotinamide-nucleotide amidase